MPTISAFYGILIQMFWQEHAPPHFHALYGEFEALIDIRTLEVIWERRGRKEGTLLKIVKIIICLFFKAAYLLKELTN